MNSEAEREDCSYNMYRYHFFCMADFPTAINY